MSGGSSILLAAAVFVVVSIYARTCEPFFFVGDDGGITLRYATRIAHGQGFAYNDFEVVNGASHLLNTIVLSWLLGAGFTPGEAIRWLGDVCFTLVASIGAWTMLRRYSPVGAGAYLLLLLGTVVVFEECFNGLESPLLFVLITALFGALHTRAWVVQSILLALLVVNKLDGAMASLAIGICWLGRDARRLWRIAALTAALLLPVFAAQYLHFGTPMPKSAAMKLFDHEIANFDPTWVARAIWVWAGWVLPFAALALVLRRNERRLETWAMAAWALLHALVFSAINLGDYYPWYCDGPIMIAFVLAAVGIHALGRTTIDVARGALRKLGADRNAWRHADVPAGLAVCALATFAATEMHLLRTLAWRWYSFGGTLHTSPHSMGELARQAPGTWLRLVTSRTERVCTPYGLPALEYPGTVIDWTGLNSTNGREMCLTAQYFVIETGVDMGGMLASLPVVAEFQYGTAARRYSIHATPDSEVMRSGQRLWWYAPSQFARLDGASVGSAALAGVAAETLDIPRGATAVATLPRAVTSLCFVLGLDENAAQKESIRIAVAGADGEELGAVDFDRAQDDPAIVLPLRRPSETLRITVEGNERDVRLLGCTAREGSLPNASDFALTSPRLTQLVEHVARYGLVGG